MCPLCCELALLYAGRIERQRLRALAELHASILIQRAWRGSQGRGIAFRRAAAIAFARETAERYVKPDRFAVVNLRAFNAHGGLLGTAGVDARSLLAAAVGLGSGGRVAKVKQKRRNRLVGSGKNPEGKEACGDDGEGVWLRLKPHGEDDWGLSADDRVAGIVDVGIRVCLRRCYASHVVAAALPPPGISEGEDTPQAEMEGTNELSNTSSGFGDIRDIPPLTLKLELISIQSGSCLPNLEDYEEQSRKGTAVAAHSIESDDDSSLASSDYGSGEVSGSASSSGSDRGRRPRGSRNSGSSSCGSTQPERHHSETTDESSDGCSNSDASKQSTRTDTTAASSDGSDADEGKDKSRRRSSGRDLDKDSRLDDCVELGKQQHLCEVTWCGETVGGTGAPMAGLPTPRWEGQVFYLPLCAAADNSRAGTSAAAASKEAHRNLCGAGNQITGDGCWVEEGRHRHGAGGQEWAREPPPPLLMVTLNKLSRETGGRSPCKGGDQGGRTRVGSTTDKTPWSSFVSGLIHPRPVGRVVLEAGDILSMLGSQQVSSMSVISSFWCLTRY